MASLKILVPATVHCHDSLHDFIAAIFVGDNPPRALTLQLLDDRLEEEAAKLSADDPKSVYIERLQGEARALLKFLGTGTYRAGDATRCFILKD